MPEHDLTRRSFFGCGIALTSCLAARSQAADLPGVAPELSSALKNLESYMTVPSEFRDVSRGNPLPHRLSAEKKREVGLHRDTWKLEIVSDPDKPATLDKQFTLKDRTAFDFASLIELGKKRAVRFAKVMTCLNIGCPLGMGIWEGVPLRDVLWLTQPRANLRRVFYHGYHNDDPKQIFRSSLPVGRVLEDPDGLPPVILCYKLNGEWLDSERGGPVRIVVPEAYGFKSVKWLTRVTLSNLAHANDTYADGNNDIDSPLKTFAATLKVPAIVKPNEPFPVLGYAQVGVSGLAKVQVWLNPDNKPWSADDPYFINAPWVDATILPPPANCGGKLPGNTIPDGVFGFTDAKPNTWPMRLTKAHWAIMMPGVAAGKYTLRCRTIDSNQQAQPMPRPFKKSGRCDIEEVTIRVQGN